MDQALTCRSACSRGAPSWPEALRCHSTPRQVAGTVGEASPQQEVERCSGNTHAQADARLSSRAYESEIGVVGILHMCRSGTLMDDAHSEKASIRDVVGDSVCAIASSECIVPCHLLYSESTLRNQSEFIPGLTTCGDHMTIREPYVAD